LLCAVIYLVLGIMMANQLELLSTLISFGALTGFLLLHMSVIVHFMGRQKSKNWLRHLVVRLIGFVIIAYVLFKMGVHAKIAGSAWLMVGGAAFMVLRLRDREGTLPA